MLWPKFESQEVGLKLAYTGTIKDEILDAEEVAFYLLKYLIDNYLEKLCEKYKMNIEEVRNIINSEEDENQAILNILEMIGKARGAYMSRTEK